MAGPLGQRPHMFKDVPIQVWLLIAIVAAGYTSARFVFTYIARSPSRRDITLPPEDLSWRTSEQLARNLAILGGLAASAIFIFTPAATAFAHSPNFFPMLMVALGGWAIATVARGFSTGLIQPFSKGFHEDYERQLQPKRFWASMGWNAIFGCASFWLAFQSYKEGPVQALNDQCYDAKDVNSAQKQLAACNELIAQHGNDRKMATWLAWRGSAYFRLQDYARAKADYNEAVRLDPSDSSSFYNLGLVDEQDGNVARAVANYTAAIRVGTDDADAYVRRGLIFLETGKFDEGVADFTRAHELKPTDPLPIANRGISYAWKRDHYRAEKDFAAVRALDPSNPVMLRGEALLSFNEGNMQAAVDKLTASLKSEPGNRWALRMRADAYSRLGNEEKSFDDKDELWRLSKASNEVKPAS